MRGVAILLVLLFAVAPAVCQGSAIVAQSVRLVGSSSTKYPSFWKPSDAVTFREGVGAVRVATSPGGCVSDNCARSVVAFSTDGGETFSVAETTQHFCGSYGPLLDGRLLCPAKRSLLAVNDSAAEVDVWQFEISTSFFSSGLREKKLSGEKMSFMLSTAHGRRGVLSKVVLSGNPIYVEDSSVHFWNADVTVIAPTPDSGDENVAGTNEPAHFHALFGSTDALRWTSLSVVMDLTEGADEDKASLVRAGSSDLVITHATGSDFTAQRRSISRDLGKTWSASTVINSTSLPASSTAEYFTVMSVGTTPGNRGVSYNGLNSKTKSLSFARLHNRMIEKGNVGVDKKIVPFSDTFVNATIDSCPTSFSEDSNSPCGVSSSVMAVTNLNRGFATVFYDMVVEGDYRVFAMKLLVNETKEQKEHDDRILKAKRDAQRAKEWEEARLKAKREAEERRAEERRERKRKEAEVKQAFLDAEMVFLRKAREMKELDGELVVVRDVTEGFVDYEKKTFYS